jgi:hypothetical protein
MPAAIAAAVVVGDLASVVIDRLCSGSRRHPFLRPLHWRPTRTNRKVRARYNLITTRDEVGLGITVLVAAQLIDRRDRWAV